MDASVSWADSLGLRVGGRLDGVVHWVDRSLIILAKGRTLFTSRDGGVSWTKLTRLPVSLKHRLVSQHRLGRRLFRSGVHHTVRVGQRVVVIGFGQIFVVGLETGDLLAPPTPIIGSRPLVLAADDGGALFYGEYRDNAERSPVHVFASRDHGCTWRPAYQFEGVRHVHGVFYDRYQHAVWVTTGDDDGECAIWRTMDDFASLEHIVGGSQQLRSVQLLFDEHYVYFGSDTPLERNHLYRLSRSSGEVERLQEVEGSVFYGVRAAGLIVFATVCEPSQVHRTKAAVVWGSADGTKWTRLLKFRKDRWDGRLFQYGQVLFPNGPILEDRLWITPFATWGDQRSLELVVSG